MVMLQLEGIAAVGAGGQTEMVDEGRQSGQCVAGAIVAILDEAVKPESAERGVVGEGEAGQAGASAGTQLPPNRQFQTGVPGRTCVDPKPSPLGRRSVTSIWLNCM